MENSLGEGLLPGDGDLLFFSDWNTDKSDKRGDSDLLGGFLINY